MARQKSFDGIRDPDNYRELSKPFASAQEAADNFKEFFDGVGELRKKHRMTDVYVIIAFNCLDEDGEEGQRFGSFHYGNNLMAEGMTAWAYGREQESRDALIGRALKSGRGKGKDDEASK